MINFNAGAKRPAKDDARTARINAANELVQRTLAQHGLMPGGDKPAGDLPSGLPDMQDILARFQLPLGTGTSGTGTFGTGTSGTGTFGMGTQDADIPNGARFQQSQFTCAAGSRANLTYVPSTASQGVTGIVVMLHGCTQNPGDFAAGTGMNALAEQHGFVVIYPQQTRGDNAQSCWNWFSRGDQRRDRGEPAILAEMTRKAMIEHEVAADRTFVAGLSAGAAMAVILGQTYPDVFAAVGAHSGLPFGAAKDVPSAFAAMAGNGSDTSANTTDGKPTPTIVFHGTADATVHPANGDRIARNATDRSAAQTIHTEESGTASGRSFARKITSTPDGATAVEHWIIDGLGHAWSGGRPQGSYTDAKGPDASAEMIRFFYETADRTV